jgi:DNA helicase IV
MTQQHPEFAEEQAFIDHAYTCLELSRQDAWKLRGMTETGLGGTMQNRYERNVFDEALVNRLETLDIGDAALVFGRIDRVAESPDQFESFHIGRLAVADEAREPVVVDWRAPVAEPFYRATGREPMGLARRRHFAVQGRELLGIEDELFGEGHLGVGHDEGLNGSDPSSGLRGYSTLLSVLERGRTGQLGDIVATIQAEQDEIIRSPQAGVLVVQGGPGTGKTVVALHRAAYLLYTFRFPLEDQGVLVIGPNRVFLRYIERVLPSLGEAGVEQVVLADLVNDVNYGGVDSSHTERVKGGKKMSSVIEKAISDRERPLKEDLVFPFRTGYVRLRKDVSVDIVKTARRRYHRHNPARKFVESEVWNALAATWRTDVTMEELQDAIRPLPEFRAALERMWPVLTPAQLLHDLFGSKALLRLACTGTLSEADYLSLYRERSSVVEDVKWAQSDIALLDEARFQLGPKPRRSGKSTDADEIRTFGHIVVDEVQDLTPMQLRMVTRRSLNGSMTIVGDIAQATGSVAPNTWDDVLQHLPSRKTPRVTGLSVGYRIPAPIMELADKVMLAATPGLRAPRSVRTGGEPPQFERTTSSDDLGHAAARVVRKIQSSREYGNAAVVCPDSMVEAMSTALNAAGISHGIANTTGLGDDVTVVPVTLVKGLELDDVIVVEPQRIVEDHEQGLRLLYVALTRSTQSLHIVHCEPLPQCML